MSKTEDLVLQLAEPIARQFGVMVYDVDYKKEGADWFLRVFLYSGEGIGMDDCESVSRALSDELDREDLIKTSYYLEVSSPGLNRRLTKDWHFEKALGESVLINLYKAENGSKKSKVCLRDMTLPLYRLKKKVMY